MRWGVLMSPDWLTQIVVKMKYELNIEMNEISADYLGVFVNGPGDLGSIPGHVIPKTLKMALDTSLLYTQQYKVCIKGKVEQIRERSSAPLHLGVIAIEKGASWSPSTTVTHFTLLTLLFHCHYYILTWSGSTC